MDSQSDFDSQSEWGLTPTPHGLEAAGSSPPNSKRKREQQATAAQSQSYVPGVADGTSGPVGATRADYHLRLARAHENAPEGSYRAAVAAGGQLAREHGVSADAHVQANSRH